MKNNDKIDDELALKIGRCVLELFNVSVFQIKSINQSIMESNHEYNIVCRIVGSIKDKDIKDKIGNDEQKESHVVKKKRNRSEKDTDDSYLIRSAIENME